MSQKASTPPKIDLVAWSGDVSQLATRLRIAEADLLRRLKPLAAGRQGSRLVVEVTPANCSPILAALARRMNGEACA